MLFYKLRSIEFSALRQETCKIFWIFFCACRSASLMRSCFKTHLKTVNYLLDLCIYSVRIGDFGANRSHQV